jgi:hypothetical protein
VSASGPLALLKTDDDLDYSSVRKLTVFALVRAKTHVFRNRKSPAAAQKGSNLIRISLCLNKLLVSARAILMWHEACLIVVTLSVRSRTFHENDRTWLHSD